MPLRFLALAAGVLIVSTAALLIRFAIDAGAGPLAVAAGRLTLAAAVVVPLAMWRRGPELRRLQRRDWGIAAVAGLFLAVHFATWIASLNYTSVASSVALVTTNPIWVGLLSWWLLGEPPTRRTAAGIAMAVAGSALIIASDLAAAPGPAGRRTVKAGDFFQGPYMTALAEDEILVAIRVPALAKGTGWAYEKLKRKTGDWATAGAAVVMRIDGGIVTHVRVALTNLAPTAIRALDAEVALLGEPLSDTTIDKAAAAAMAVADPAADLRGDVEYKTAMAGQMVKRALRNAASRCQ